MNDRLPWDITAADADDENAAAAAAAQVVRRIIVGLLLTAAALDLTRCGLVMTAARHPAFHAQQSAGYDMGRWLCLGNLFQVSPACSPPTWPDAVSSAQMLPKEQPGRIAAVVMTAGRCPRAGSGAVGGTRR
jgi:hypothetical protein